MGSLRKKIIESINKVIKIYSYQCHVLKVKRAAKDRTCCTISVIDCYLMSFPKTAMNQLRL